MNKVSVIIPAHRLDRWLDEAVLSALASTNVEIEVVVVVNGVETIPSSSWVEDCRVTLIHKPAPLGPTGAMILGLQHTTGDYVARLDADDRMAPTRLFSQADYLDNHPLTHLVGTLVRRITPQGVDAGLIRMPSGQDVRRSLLLTNVVTHSSILIRREALDLVGGYNENLTQMEDYDVILRLGCQGEIAILPEALTEYRLHESQISRGARPTGKHVDTVIAGRRQLGRVLGISPIEVFFKNLLWRLVQFTRYSRLTKPGHEY